MLPLNCLLPAALAHRFRHPPALVMAVALGLVLSPAVLAQAPAAPAVAAPVSATTQAQKELQEEFDARLAKLRKQLAAEVTKAEQAVAAARQKVEDSELELTRLKGEMAKAGLFPAVGLPEASAPAEAVAVTVPPAEPAKPARPGVFSRWFHAATGAVRKEVAGTRPAALPPSDVATAQGTGVPALLLPVPIGQTVMVNGFRFAGNTSIPTAELQMVVASYVGQSCDLRQLREAAEKVTAEYRRRGLTVAKAYLPAQQSAEGVFEITVLEGRLGEVYVEGNKNYSSEFVRAYIVRALRGPAVTSKQLESALLTLNSEFPDLKTSAVLEPGKEPGSVDIRAKVEDKRPIFGTLSLNNYGSDYVGRYRGSLQLGWINAGIPGALLSLGGIAGDKPDEMAYGNASYSVPVNHLGTKVGAMFGAGDYQVGQEFADLGMSGKSATAGVFVTHPFIRSRTFNLSGEFGFRASENKFYLLDAISSHDKTRFLYLAVNADSTNWGGKNFGTVNLSQGLGEFLGGTGSNDPLASRLDADNTFTRLSLSVARVQPLNDMFSIMARVSGQKSSSPLLASEEWQIGGPDSVRGYTSGECAGDDGYNASLELRFAPLANKEILQLLTFLDHGLVHRQRPTLGQKTNTDLTGVGVGARSHLSFGLDLRLDVGWPIDPSTNSLGEDPVIYGSAAVRF